MRTYSDHSVLWVGIKVWGFVSTDHNKAWHLVLTVSTCCCSVVGPVGDFACVTFFLTWVESHSPPLASLD